MDDYEKYKIKDYKYWALYIHENQGYLGRSVIVCRREDALDLVLATSEEVEELFVILKSLREALTKSFSPDWFNYAFLGNEFRHLHGHVIPRYANEREFAGTVFKDERWGHNYRTDHNFKISEELMQQIKHKIAENLES